MTLRSLRVPLLASTICLLASVAACDSSDDSSSFGDTKGTTTSTGSNTGGAGGAGGGTGNAGGIVISTGSAGNGSGGLEECTADEVEADPIQLDMVILLDESGSMSGQKWTGSIQALKTFINDPASAGIAVGFLVFPVDDIFDDCNFDDYKQLLVPIDVLPQNAPALIAALDAEEPQGGTPMYGALYGALTIATAHQDANPTHKVIVVLATDGDPTSCSVIDIPTIAGLAASALNYNGVETYVIGIQGSNINNLNQIASAGGTMQAYDVTQNIQAFSQKMEEIRTNALACEFNIPPPPRGEELDPELVNVNYTPGGVGMPQKIPQAANAGDCGTDPGWYYDNPSNPTKIFLCPASCNIVKADKEAKLNVAFGCKTEVN